MGRTLLIAAALMWLSAERAAAVFIDLRGLPNPQSSTSVGGITLTWGAGQLGSFVSTATRFGFDSDGSGDAADLVDGGSGTAERVAFYFSTPVYVESVVVSQFGVGDAGTFSVQNFGTFSLANGVNPLGDNVIAGEGNTNNLLWTGANASGAGRGFSVDGFNVRPVAPFSADFNFDGAVDGADFLTWQRGVGTFSPPAASPVQGNANFDERVDRLDLEVWGLQFGGAALAGVVPEPPRGMLALAGVMVVGGARGALRYGGPSRRG